jgi:hypothetical protein
MKPLTLLGLLLSGLAGCKQSNPAPAPGPATAPVTIEVRTTANCPGIAPTYRVISNAEHYSGGSLVTRFFQLAVSQDQVDETRVVLVNPGPQYAADSLGASIALPSPYASFTIPRGGFAQVDILVNGKIRKSARVDEHTPLRSRAPYFVEQVYFRFKDL